MNELCPIIRRKRRPLMVEDKPPVVTGSVEPVKVEAVVSREVSEGGEGKANEAHGVSEAQS